MNLAKNQAFLITSDYNIYYYSKITVAQGVFLLLTKNQKFVFADARFIDQAKKIARNFTPITIDKEDQNWWRQLIKKKKIKTIYFEPDHLTYKKVLKFRRLSKKLAKFQPSPFNLQKIRSQKQKVEVAKIKQALKISEQILEDLVLIIKKNPNISEYDLVLEIYKQSFKYHCHNLAFKPIVAFGSHSGVAHHQSGQNCYLEKNNLILIDMGVKYQNYCADITRVFFNSAPTTRQAKVYQRVLKAQKLAISKIKPGQKASKLCQSVYNFFGSKLSDHFTHGLGHGVGLQIHEYPSLKQKSPDTIASGQIFTIEPGLYFSWGGVRIEDMIWVDNNQTKILTQFPKELKQVII